jgi:C-terminal processing protease CtpA/Prc
MPHFERLDGHIYALPLPIKTEDGTIAVDSLIGRFAGGGALEVFDLEKVSKTLKKMTKSDDGKTENTDSQPNNRKRFRAKLARFLQRLRLKGSKLQETSTEAPSMSPTILNNSTIEDPFPKDAELDLTNEDSDFSLPRKAYRLAHLPRGKYFTILSQTTDDGSLVVIEQNDDTSSPILRLFAADSFPSDTFESKSGDTTLSQWGLSTCRRYIHLVSSTGKVTVISNTETGVSALLRDTEWTENLADVDDMAISVWPTLEYRQMYGDAWRLLRDYFYDTNMHNVDWKEMFRRYEPLVRRCAKREDLDDVLGMLIAELSALHSFVYGGEYHTPDRPPWSPASLGAAFRRAPEWKGYEVIDVPLRDPDFNVLDGRAQYCPISDQALRPTGQRGLQIGDIIIAVNGESVMHGPGLNYRLRGMAGRSVRLEVLRLGSGNLNDTASVIPESLVTVPITGPDADDLRYGAWEWKTRQLAKQLAAEAGFSVGYVHMQAMTRDGFDAFARGFFPDYDKDALIIDVRHNLGGNIDSWILTYLQRQAWSFWAGRGVNERNGDLDWDAQFAFRGKVVVLVDERTGSNGEGVARAISELGLGRIIGKRTWGGGIWGSSSNRLVDGGIASAPQWGVYNDKLGWGAGVEMTGVDPEIVIDNDPRLTFDGRDEQLERAISELSSWLKKSPIPEFQVAIERPDMSLKLNNCPA